MTNPFSSYQGPFNCVLYKLDANRHAEQQARTVDETLTELGLAERPLLDGTEQGGREFPASPQLRT